MGGPVGSPISGDYESRAVNTFVESCFESTLEDGIYYVSFQGGYYDVPGLSRKYFDLTVPYYWHSYEDSMPSLETIEQELGKYMEKNIQNCLKGFEPFQALGYDIEYDSPKITVGIIEGAVMADINFPITIKATDRVTKLQKFRARKEENILRAAKRKFWAYEKIRNYAKA